MDVVAYLAAGARDVEAFLDRALPRGGGCPSPLPEAMRYSALDGGKRLRPSLTLASAVCVGGDGVEAMPVAAALEMIHTYSLIHDDLPAMDDDDFRRGKPTNHKQFGEAVAILAGDALLTQAFQVLGEAEGVSPSNRLRIIVEVAAACGPAGLIGGQMADLEAAGKEVDLPALEYIHTHKTGAMIQAAVRCGALAAGAGEEDLETLTSYARKIGLAFQIVDDILDVEGDPEETGKASGRDRVLRKATYPALLGLQESRRRAEELIEEAVGALERFGPRAEALEAMARFIGERSH